MSRKGVGVSMSRKGVGVSMIVQRAVRGSSDRAWRNPRRDHRTLGQLSVREGWLLSASLQRELCFRRTGKILPLRVPSQQPIPRGMGLPGMGGA
jgi:hypothetical protein